MDQLVKMVSEKAGISEKQAKTAIEVVYGFIKDKLPPQLAGTLDKALSDEKDVDLSDAASMLGDLLKKK